MRKILGSSTLAMTALTLQAQQPATLDSMRDRYRPVLIFAGSTTPQTVVQLHVFAEGERDLQERDVLIVPVVLHGKAPAVGPRQEGISLSPKERSALRRRFHIRPTDFTVILVGKDGGEKLRSHVPMSLETLRTTIDAMPMRQHEMKSSQ